MGDMIPVRSVCDRKICSDCGRRNYSELICEMRSIFKSKKGEYGLYKGKLTQQEKSQGKIKAKRGGKKHTVDALIQLE